MTSVMGAILGVSIVLAFVGVVSLFGALDDQYSQGKRDARAVRNNYYVPRNDWHRGPLRWAYEAGVYSMSRDDSRKLRIEARGARRRAKLERRDKISQERWAKRAY